MLPRRLIYLTAAVIADLLGFVSVTEGRSSPLSTIITFSNTF